MTTKRERMYERIERHGRNLLALFPDASEQDPVKLCKKLRRYEVELHKAAENYCNDPDYDIEEVYVPVMKKVYSLLGHIPSAFPGRQVFFNQDPRGYALKVDLVDGERLHTDMGGYGIIAPDLRED